MWASLLRGTDMFECTTCADMWTYCVDCKRAWDLRPSYNQRQHNAQARARGQALYQFTPTRQPSERYVPAVGGEQEEEQEKKRRTKRNITRGRRRRDRCDSLDSGEARDPFRGYHGLFDEVR